MRSLNEKSVIFSRTYDLLTWLLPKSESFPKLYRFSVTQRLMDALLNFQEALYDADVEQGQKRLSQLHRANSHLNKVRLYLRLAHQWQWLSHGQYQHVSVMIEEIGRLLGGWISETRA